MTLHLVPSVHRATHRIGLYLGALREGLSQGEAHILAQLMTASPSTIKELHRGLAHKRSTLTSILDRLVERGFVTREVGTADRRTFVVALTPQGRRVATRVMRHLVELERRVLKRVTSTEILAFKRVVAIVEAEAHALASTADRRAST